MLKDKEPVKLGNLVKNYEHWLKNKIVIEFWNSKKNVMKAANFLYVSDAITILSSMQKLNKSNLKQYFVVV